MAAQSVSKLLIEQQSRLSTRPHWQPVASTKALSDHVVGHQTFMTNICAFFTKSSYSRATLATWRGCLDLPQPVSEG
jgi:hypothetical protein